MPKTLKKYITVDKDILQGTPVISGTRIPVVRLFSLVKQGYNTETLREEYPHVSYTKIQKLIAYLIKAQEAKKSKSPWEFTPSYR